MEEFALDSFDNLLFSICRFQQVTGRYPEKIIVTGFPFKEHRFVNLHREAIGFPRDRFEYISSNPPTSSSSNGESGPKLDWDAIAAGELKNAAAPFRKDPFACFDETLVSKKSLRNPYNNYHGYAASCPAMKSLFSYCTEKKLENLPW